MKDHNNDKQKIIEFYQSVRNKTESLCQPLAIEDYVIQSMGDVSPPKWHLAHTTWFFETFLLSPLLPKYKLFHPLFNHLFNSYYQRIGYPYPRIQRGFLSRPTVETIYQYRKYVDEHVYALLDKNLDEKKIISIMTLGLHHEQQHQELLMMDIKYNFSLHLDYPIYSKNNSSVMSSHPMNLIHVAGGMVELGHHGSEFCFDNELPLHRQFIQPYRISSRLVTNAEYAEFIEAKGYQNPEWWLADGWDCVLKNDWHAPLYWHKINNSWHIFTLSGLKALDPFEPVSHVSFYEADAYARWRGLRLPKEAEWEHYATSYSQAGIEGNFLENQFFHPQASSPQDKSPVKQLLGDLWEWTASAYSPYPGYKPLDGALGEYNGKFMSNQMVLRGGCCVTPKDHIRISYRNFFQLDKRWQFSGIRLASDV